MCKQDCKVNLASVLLSNVQDCGIAKKTCDIKTHGEFVIDNSEFILYIRLNYATMCHEQDLLTIELNQTSLLAPAHLGKL